MKVRNSILALSDHNQLTTLRCKKMVTQRHVKYFYLSEANITLKTHKWAGIDQVFVKSNF